MSQQSGGNVQVKMTGKETTFGTAPATPSAIVLPYSDESLSRKSTLNKSNIIRTNRNSVKPTRGKREAAGNIKSEFNVMCGRQLFACFGGVTTSGAGSNKTHVLKFGSSLPSYTLEKGFADLATPQYFQYVGSKINKFSFEIGPDGPVPFDMEWMGADRIISSTTIDAAATDLGHIPFDSFELGIKEGGSAIAVVTSVKVNVEQNLDGGVYCVGGAGKRYSLPEGIVLVSGSVMAVFDSMALLTKAANGTETSLQITATKGTGDGTAGNESLDFLIEELMYEEQDPIVKDRNGILVELPFTAYWDNGAGGSSMIATLKNTQATLNV